MHLNVWQQSKLRVAFPRPFFYFISFYLFISLFAVDEQYIQLCSGAMCLIPPSSPPFPRITTFFLPHPTPILLSTTPFTSSFSVYLLIALTWMLCYCLPGLGRWYYKYSVTVGLHLKWKECFNQNQKHDPRATARSKSLMGHSVPLIDCAFLSH